MYERDSFGICICADGSKQSRYARSDVCAEDDKQSVFERHNFCADHSYHDARRRGRTLNQSREHRADKNKKQRKIDNAENISEKRFDERTSERLLAAHDVKTDEDKT